MTAPTQPSAKSFVALSDHSLTAVFVRYLAIFGAAACLFIAARSYLMAILCSAYALTLLGTVCARKGERTGYVAGRSDGKREATRTASQEYKVQLQRAMARVDKIFSELGRPVPGKGYLYIAQFATGSIKVGQTCDPKSRLAQHRRSARAFGTPVVNLWVSVAHANYLSNETLLLAHCMKLGVRTKREYFRGLAFETAVSVAAGLTYDDAGIEAPA